MISEFYGPLAEKWPLKLSQKYADVSGRSRVNLQRYNPQLAGECRVSFCRVRHPVFANNAAEQLFGASINQLRGQLSIKFCHWIVRRRSYPPGATNRF